jgi:hypothetical protein
MRDARMSRRRLVALTVGALLVLGACAGEDDMTTPPSVPDDALEVPGASDVTLLGTQEITPEIEAAIADAAERFGVDPATIAVARSLGVTWSDGSLGCPEEGMMYTQALVEGYLITLEVAGARYDYHGATGGAPTLCEQG